MSTDLKWEKYRLYSNEDEFKDDKGKIQIIKKNS